ncbi:MAG: valine--tRNA ligase [Firmicutes bacterium]|nr:valine--tRNA ligase [Bacillota bacterium]
MLDKKYDHKQTEHNKYNTWKENGYFKSGELSKKPFCIVIPPPNVTGKLHLGHAWNTTLQDIIIRYKRMCGYDALWLPGMDHAGIATQAKIDKKLKDEGINPRSMDREEWLKHAWAWKEEYAQNIHEQWAKMGLSLDYTKERFTLDEGLSDAVKHVFVTLYNEGLIYRGERIINWDPEAMTALSNEEVIYKDVEGAFYHVKYMIEDSNDYLEVATTRPETLFGDTAVAVNPNDDRYKHLIGKNVILPIINKTIPIVGDEHADPEFGTGVVKITPAHDPNDFEVGNRHNLPRVNVMNPDGTMNENASICSGMDRFEAREKVIEELTKQNLLIDIEKIVHSVGHSERTDVMIEPYLSKQWFVKMRPLADRVLENQKDKDTKVNFVPERYEKIQNHWMEITYDWCISRQLWWGHRIPAWYKGDEVYVGYEAPTEEGWIQDSDVLDTWFSSALWPFSTLGWPENTDLLKRYYPNNVLVTGYDIIPFWVCRMVFQGLKFLDERPFKDCLIHGLIRDNQGRKMSKSLGNGIDPMDVIEEYGADSLRYFLTTSSAPGTDLRFDMEKVKSTWNFINKLWNASRFVMMNLEDFNLESYSLNNLSSQDKWILNKLNNTIKSVTKNMERYDFHVVGSELYNFIWNEFCDWYIELAKTNMNDTTKSVLLHVLNQILKMLHPFMPYVTEEIWTNLPGNNGSIMISEYPVYNEDFVFEDKTIDNVIELIKSIRTIKLENNLKEFNLVYNETEEEFINETKLIIKKLLKLDDEDIKLTGSFDLDGLSYIEVPLSFATFKISFIKVIDNKAEIERLTKEQDALIISISRREKLLSNENYVNKAPEAVVNKDRELLLIEKTKLQTIAEQLENLGK